MQRDPSEELRWLHRAAKHGDEQSFRLLADFYRNGYDGVPLDLEEAHRWDKKYRQTELYRLPKEKRVGKEPRSE